MPMTISPPSLRPSTRLRLIAVVAGVGLVLTTNPARAAAPKVPEGFRIRLVAAVPAVQYPSQVCTAPDGALFVGEDPMDQVGPASKPIDRIKLFREGKEPTVFAEKLNAIFGMAWRDGSLYVMNMPNLTVLTDTDGDGKADRRTELFRDLGVPAGSPNDFNDHIVSGIKFGIDGYLYISVGDKGVPKATGRDGRTAQVVGGGILRCRPDGTGLEVFSTGTRNHLEPNLDARDNLFTYDNTDDGLGWWTRVTHHVDGGFYGYPYDYHDRSDRILPRMAEYGGGSPCGGVVYAEDVWPEKYRGRAFWAEWGKRTVRAFRFEPFGASFRVADVIDFAEPGEVGDFRPLDLALSHDGTTLYIADWSFGGWANKSEKLGRVYAVTYAGADKVKTRARGKDSDPFPALVNQLDHPSLNERSRAQAALIKRGKPALVPSTAALSDPQTPGLARRHLLWVIDALAGGTPEASLPLIAALKDPEAEVRAQAARALGERGVALAGEALALLVRDNDPAVRLQAVIALGRIGDPSTAAALIPVVADPDVFLAYSARKALQRIGEWDAVARGLDSADDRIRAGLLLTLEDVYRPDTVQTLVRFAGTAARPAAERARAVSYLAAVCRKAPPWDGRWWGTQPARNKAPARTIEWAGTTLVAETIRRLLDDPEPVVRIAAVEAVVATVDRSALPRLRARFTDDPALGVRRALARAFGTLDDRQAIPPLAAALHDRKTPQSVREEALQAVEAIRSEAAIKVLVELVRSKTLDDDHKVTIIGALGRSRSPLAAGALLDTLADPRPAVRAASAGALAELFRKGDEKAVGRVTAALRARLDDPAVEVRNRAIAALGALGDRAAIPGLIAAAQNDETRFEAASALAKMPDIAALQVYLAALLDRSPELRDAAGTAIGNLRDRAIPVLDQLAGRHELPPAVLPALRGLFSGPEPITAWKVLGPFPLKSPQAIPPERPVDLAASLEGAGGKRVTWKAVRPDDPKGRVDLGRAYSHDNDLSAYGYAEFESASARKAQMVVGSDDTLTVWLNGEQVYDFEDRRSFGHEQARFDVPLAKGTNRVLVRCGNGGGPWQFSVALTGAPEHAFLKGPAGPGFNPDVYRAQALKSRGEPARGKALFADLKGLACIKCHAVNRQGGAVGPDLTGVGSKYPRDELITAVLYPSAKIASGYEPTIFALEDGRLVTGIVRSESRDAIEIQDVDAKVVRVTPSDVEDRRRSDVSLMPNGLAQGIGPGDFADLIAYLESLRDAPAPRGSK